MRWRSVSVPSRGRKGLGRSAELSGHSRVPPPPARITTYIGSILGTATGAIPAARAPAPSGIDAGVQVAVAGHAGGLDVEPVGGDGHDRPRGEGEERRPCPNPSWGPCSDGPRSSRSSRTVTTDRRLSVSPRWSRMTPLTLRLRVHPGERHAEVGDPVLREVGRRVVRNPGRVRQIAPGPGIVDRASGCSSDPCWSDEQGATGRLERAGRVGDPGLLAAAASFSGAMRATTLQSLSPSETYVSVTRRRRDGRGTTDGSARGSAWGCRRSRSDRRGRSIGAAAMALGGGPLRERRRPCRPTAAR